jgi:hypothetical protein
VAPTTGIAMCQNVVDVAESIESAYGYKRTSRRPKSTSALPPTPDILGAVTDFRV